MAWNSVEKRNKTDYLHDVHDPSENPAVQHVSTVLLECAPQGKTSGGKTCHTQGHKFEVTTAPRSDMRIPNTFFTSWGLFLVRPHSWKNFLGQKESEQTACLTGFSDIGICQSYACEGHYDLQKPEKEGGLTIDSDLAITILVTGGQESLGFLHDVFHAPTFHSNLAISILIARSHQRPGLSHSQLSRPRREVLKEQPDGTMNTLCPSASEELLRDPECKKQPNVSVLKPMEISPTPQNASSSSSSSSFIS
ncbi:hypothetical protein EYF80_020452 [Liparis tanakae]|uniref:Uncharacterized protein n=1 Tax=Liparis tanakae TaxID=230148 RepID=A0A4Z2HUR5_9TELE|nr:hypothetical protein EYF80_020452 [Liparis tanakae]